MDITRFSTRYAVRLLGEADIPQILTLCSKNGLYYQYCPPFVTEDSIRKDMQALPPRKTMDDKFYIGYFDGDKLIAVMDFIRGFPDEQTAFIGFFMLDVSVQGHGEGSAIIAELCAHLSEVGFAFVRLGWAKGNPQSSHFWRKNGFAETGVTYDAGGYTVIVAQKPLSLVLRPDPLLPESTGPVSGGLSAVCGLLKNRYELLPTHSFAVDDGFTEDFPILVGQAHGMILWLYECDGDFVLDVMDAEATRGTHWHPQDAASVAEDIAEFMEGRGDYRLFPFAQA